MSAPSNKSSLAVMIAIVAFLFSAWVDAAENVPNLPENAVCKVVSTTIRTDSKGRTIITVKKVCEVSK